MAASTGRALAELFDESVQFLSEFARVHLLNVSTKVQEILPADGALKKCLPLLVITTFNE